MAENAPNRTVPHTPPATDCTADHVPSDDTRPRATDESNTPDAAGTVVRTPSDVVLLEASAQAQSAEGVPGYVLLGELGRGGMGVVHKARHLKLNRVVALKMMLGGEQANRSELIRFLAEAEAVAAIKHENVVQVFDYGEANGRPFMALEFCAGGTLGKLLPKGTDAARDPGAMAALVAKVARGVAAAHALGIVHRDLKPGNVFLDDAGVPKVADFGLAKRGDGSDVTREGTGMGTPAYMAPEQARDAKFVGPQADVWALGVILYEALTGQRPFTGTVQEVMAKAQNADPLAPRAVLRTVPHDLELICLHCLAKQPHERYATAKELADDLERYARNEPIRVRPAGPIERGYKWVRRNKVVSGAALAVFLALSVGLGLSIGFGREANKQAEDAKKQKEEADKATAREAKEKKDAIDARNDLKEKNDELIRSRERVNRTLAKALLGPINAKNRDRPLTPYEVETFWQLAGLRRDEVPLMFLEAATRTPLACEQLECRAEYAFHGAIGLDVKRRDAADKLLLALLQHDLASGQSLSLAQACSRWEGTSNTVATRAADLLVAALGKERDSYARQRLADGLLAVVGRMEPDKAAEVCAKAADLLTTALAKEMAPLARASLAVAMSALAVRMEPDKATEVCAKAADLLTTALAKETDSDDRRTLVVGLSALAVRIEPAKAAEVCARAADLLVAALAKGTGRRDNDSLAEGLSAVARHMDPAKAADLLMAALAKETDSIPRGALVKGLSAVAARMDPAKAADLLVAALGKERDSYARQRLAEALSAVARRMESDKSVDLLTTALAKETAPLARQRLAEGLSAVARHMDPAKAADLLMAALAKETAPLAHTTLAKGLSAVAWHMDPAKAAGGCAKAADLLVAALAKTTNAFDSHSLAEGLSAVAARMDPAKAAEVCAQAADLLTTALAKETDSSPRGALVKGLSAVAGRMEPAKAAEVCARAADLLVTPRAEDDLRDPRDSARIISG